MISNNGHVDIVDTIGAKKEKYVIAEGDIVRLVSRVVYAYKRPYESTVREYVVNARDAMKLRGLTKPVEVYTPTELKPSLMIRDYGGGMTEEETRGLLFSFGASGEYKKVSNDYVGGFGIGSKSAFNLTDAFTFTVFRDGKKHVWSCQLDEERFPTAAKLSEEPTDEEDGIMVTIPYEPAKAIPPKDIEKNVLQWLDVPCLLNGRRVVPYTESRGFSGETAGKLGHVYKWRLTKPDMDSNRNELTFVVGCGMIGVNYWDLPGTVRSNIDLPDWMKHHLVVDIPIGAATLMTSREDFTYDDRTKEVLVDAISACVKDAKKMVVDTVGSKTTVKEVMEAVAEIFHICGAHETCEMLSEAGGMGEGLTERFKYKDFREALCHELDPTEAGVAGMFVSLPVQKGKYTGEYRYKAYDMFRDDLLPASMSSGNLAVYKGAAATRQTEFWGYGYAQEILRLLGPTTKGGNGVLVAVDKPGQAAQGTENRVKFVFEYFYPSQVKFRLLPTLVKRFTGLVKERIAIPNNAGSPSAGSAILVDMRGDVWKMRDYLKKHFPDAPVEVCSNVPCSRTPRASRSGTHTPAEYIAWPVEISGLDEFQSDKLPSAPTKEKEKFIEKMSSYGVHLTVGAKTTLRRLPVSDKPIMFVESSPKKGQFGDSAMYDIRVSVLKAMLSGADVAKDKNGVPIVVLSDRSLSLRYPGKFVDADDLGKDEKIDDDTANRTAFWIYRMLCDRDGAHGHGMFNRISGGYMLPVDMQCLKHSQGLFRDVCGILAKKRLEKPVMEGVKALAKLMEPPTKIPLRAMNGFRGLGYGAETTRKYAKMLLDVFGDPGEMPLAWSALRYERQYDTAKPAVKKRIAEDLALLVCGRSQRIREKRLAAAGKKEDDREDNAGKEAAVDCA